MVLCTNQQDNNKLEQAAEKLLQVPSITSLE